MGKNQTHQMTEKSRRHIVHHEKRKSLYSVLSQVIAVKKDVSEDSLASESFSRHTFTVILHPE